MPDKSEVRVFSIHGLYLKDVQPFNSPYHERIVYNKDGIAIQSATFFYDIQLNAIGYDLTGNVINKTAYDAPYKLTIEELRKLIQDRFNVDIMDTAQTSRVHRFEEKNTTNLPYYLVNYYDHQDHRKYHEVLINANTGEILQTVNGYFVSEKNPDIWQEFVKQKNNE